MQVWLHAFSFPHRTAALARQAEAWGFTGLFVADSQNLNADVWIELALAAAATRQLQLGPGVTNPATRHPAVTASAAATLQEESGGRVVLGLGRGDSALSQIGLAPVHVAGFERALAELQGFLRGEEVVLDDDVRSSIGWIAASQQPKVPVAVAATGPHVIAAAARHAEMLDFTVGAERERLAWAIEAARAAGEAARAGALPDGAGRSPGAALSLGAFVNVAVDPDRAAARDLVRGSTAILARFGTEGAPADGLSEVTKAGIAQLGAEYEEARHGQSSAPAARRLEDDFIDRFAVCGPAGEVLERLLALRDLGLERIVVVPGSLDADAAAVEASNERFAADVLPGLLAA
ncbi:LLM class flavin-dependent oxidoreductase [Conexibacter sp. CPCC 206217]|uniref:LLM class flavin-dependent oxidoreductase n=1 Tax=Conexibacter sp. CPCC 206217 TaxID=3064574 RepID=UPI00271F47C6|nr:LLM class flavin-dependent oxidoreductase [Conexibacter sp. CPCC 206217]MDO8213961.1 LLM class flavin-dependent oxidoreductase [Conexibacter sp. CPCC 206217]